MTLPLLQQQIDYYRARAGEYDQWFYRQGRYDHGPELNARWFAEAQHVTEALDSFQPTGSVLELACGTGIWTERLARHASELTAVDASSEVLALNRQRLPSARVAYVQTDLFTWEPPPGSFDVIFFGFWLSHVPPDQFEPFWDKVCRALRPRGRFFLVDSLRAQTGTSPDQRLSDPTATTLTRRLNDGREFQIYKLFYEPDALQARLERLGWKATVSHTDHYFLHAQGSPAHAG